jgi:hypothetical protein
MMEILVGRRRKGGKFENKPNMFLELIPRIAYDRFAALADIFKSSPPG